MSETHVNKIKEEIRALPDAEFQEIRNFVNSLAYHGRTSQPNGQLAGQMIRAMFSSVERNMR